METMHVKSDPHCSFSLKPSVYARMYQAKVEASVSLSDVAGIEDGLYVLLRWADRTILEWQVECVSGEETPYQLCCFVEKERMVCTIRTTFQDFLSLLSLKGVSFEKQEWLNELEQFLEKSKLKPKTAKLGNRQSEIYAELKAHRESLQLQLEKLILQSI